MSGRDKIQWTEKEYSKAVIMEGLSSNEVMIDKEDFSRPVLHNINLEILKGEIWGVSGTSILEIKLLLEIMANIKPYKNGKCVLLERGMMRLKRIILPHVFYIGTSNMIYRNMNVLEFLMFATGNRTGNIVRHQERVFELLLSIGLGNISLTPIWTLTPEYRAMAILLTTHFSSSQLIIFNLPDLEFTHEQKLVLKNIGELLERERKTLVLSTTDYQLIETVCSHTAFVKKGTLEYAGEVKDFCRIYDRVVMRICDKSAPAIMAFLGDELPQFNYFLDRDNCLIIKDYKSDDPDTKQIYRKIAEGGFTPEDIKINEKNYKNASEEIIGNHDLQKQLF